MKKIRAFGNNVVVEPIADKATTRGGLFKPKTALAREHLMKGVVRSVGRGQPIHPKGQGLVFVPPDFAEGDHVLFKRTYGEILWADDRTELRLLDVEHVVAKCDPDTQVGLF